MFPSDFVGKAHKQQKTVLNFIEHSSETQVDIFTHFNSTYYFEETAFLRDRFRSSRRRLAWEFVRTVIGPKSIREKAHTRTLI